MKMDLDIPNIHLLLFTISIFSLMKANKYFEYPSSRSVLSEASTHSDSGIRAERDGGAF